MADFLETNLKKLAGIQRKHTRILAVLVILVTVILGVGLKDLTINSDIRKEMPNEMPIFKHNDQISDKISSEGLILW